MCGSKKTEQPTVQYSQSPEYQYQMDLFKKYQEPYTETSYNLYKDVFEPQTRALGGILGEQLSQPQNAMMGSLEDIIGQNLKSPLSEGAMSLQTSLLDQLNQPLSLPQDVWDKTWRQARERTSAEYQPIRQQATERAAGRGMLGQGATEKYFQNLDLSQAKSMEDISVDMAITEWNEKKQAKQQSIQNMMSFLPIEQSLKNMPIDQAMQYQTLQSNLGQIPIQNLMSFLGYQPQMSLPMPQSTAYSQAPQQGSNMLGSALTGGSMGALAGLALAIPTGGLSIPMGLALGGGLGAAGGAASAM